MEPDKDRMDDFLSQALKSYSAVEPRIGLETRVLVRLQAEQEKSPKWNWWWFVAAATAAAAFGIAVFVVVQPARTPLVSIPFEAMKHSLPTKDTTPPAVAHDEPKVKPSSASRLAPSGNNQQRGGEESREVEQRQEALPKLDQFPSPRLLSEEERRLASYVADYRDHALLVARAQTALSKLELQREQLLNADGPAGWSSEESNP